MDTQKSMQENHVREDPQDTEHVHSHADESPEPSMRMRAMQWLKTRLYEDPVFGTVLLIYRAFKEFQEDKATRLAAALSYYTVFSLAPLLLVVVGVAGMVLDREVVINYMATEIRGLIGPTGEDFVRGILNQQQEESSSVLSALIGLVVTLLGASGVFNHLHEAMNEIWDVPPKHRRSGIFGAVITRIWSFGLVLSVGFLLLVSLVLSAFLSALGEFLQGAMPFLEIWLRIGELVISFGLFTLLFAAMYKVLPDLHVAWHDVWIGALITSGLFSVGKFAIGLYLGNAAVGSAYGAAGSLVVLLVWIYYSAQLFFFGAELTQVYANRHGHLREKEHGPAAKAAAET